jgi:hypothetical protein
MLKFVFWLLVLANAVLFAYHQGYLEKLFPSGHEPGRISRQLNADKVKPVSASALANAEKPAVQPVSASVAAAPEKAGCVEVGNFDADESKRIEPLIALLASPDRIAKRTLQEDARHIIMIPPQGSKDAAEKKAAQLRHLGVSDFYIIQDNSDLRWGISLGIFKSEEAARGLLATLNQKGVHSAKMAPYAAGTPKTAFQIRGADDGVKNSLEKLKAEFPHEEIRECDATPA